jgi:hypothetical protein
VRNNHLDCGNLIARVRTDKSSLRGTKVDAAAVEALREANAGSGSLSRLIDDEKLESISRA